MGECGPELLSIGATGYVHNARETASMMTSSEPAAFYHIDATGANAAEIDQRVARALAVVHPRVVRDSVMVQREMARRSPRR